MTTAKRNSIYETKVTELKAEWSNLRTRDQRHFMFLIAEPDDVGCSAWQGQMKAGCPVWERIDYEANSRIRGQARRLLMQSRGVQLGVRDQVVASCRNPGCMAWDHLSVDRREALEITDAEKRQALEDASERVQNCGEHGGSHFRACFKRSNGRVLVYFKCVECDRRKKVARNCRGREFKDARQDF